MSRYIQLFGLAVMALLLPFVEAQANNVHNTNLLVDYPTLNEALADISLADGHTLILDPGVYNEDAFFNELNITIKSTYETDPTAVENTIITITTTFSSPLAIPIEMAAGVLDGLTIADSYGVSSYVVLLTNDAVIRNSIVRDNAANYDAGGVTAMGQAQVLNNTIKNNTAYTIFGSAFGLGVYAIDESLVMGNVIEGNYGSVGVSIGVGLYASNNARIISNVIRGNIGPDVNDTVVEIGGDVAFINNTVIDNIMSNFAGSVVNHYGGTISLLSNNIIAHNTGRGVDQWGEASVTHNLFYDNTLGDGDVGSNAVFADPLIDTDNTHLMNGSPAIDGGSNSGLLSTDLDIDGDERIQDITVDIGADEISSDDPPELFSLSVIGDCPRAESLAISGATANGKVIVLGSRALGVDTVPKGFCASIELGLKEPFYAISSSFADSKGDLIIAPAPSGACRANMQAIDIESCAVSEVLMSPYPNN